MQWAFSFFLVPEGKVFELPHFPFLLFSSVIHVKVGMGHKPLVSYGLSPSDIQHSFRFYKYHTEGGGHGQIPTYMNQKAASWITHSAVNKLHRTGTLNNSEQSNMFTACFFLSLHFSVFKGVGVASDANSITGYVQILSPRTTSLQLQICSMIKSLSLSDKSVLTFPDLSCTMLCKLECEKKKNPFSNTLQ